MLNIVKKQDGDTLTVKLDGRLDTNTAPDFQTEMEPLLNDISKLVLDFEKLDYISSAGLRVLLKTFQVMEAKDGRMVLKNVNEDLYDVLKLSGFVDFLEIEND